mmetsp:Transcript_97029/g.279232  ORF Transcript_97029/g.279232 Transcript_97029/m.279232 type:complete len:293 (+) Transcript_97029:1022-1900(+)
MESSCFVISLSPASVSFLLMGRMRQNTRMEPFKSSIELWSFFRLISASAMLISGTPLATASWMARVSLSLLSRRASMLVVSTDFESSKACFTPASNFSFSSSFASACSASAYSEGVSLASLAPWMAALSASLVQVSRAFARFSRASCLGSSSASTASASFNLGVDRPMSLACWMLIFRSPMSRLAMALARAPSIFSFDSDSLTICSYFASSSEARPAFLAASSAALRRSMLPSWCADSSSSRAFCRGPSFASTAFAWSMSAPVTPSSSPCLIASRRALASFPDAASRRASMA